MKFDRDLNRKYYFLFKKCVHTCDTFVRIPNTYIKT